MVESLIRILDISVGMGIESRFSSEQITEFRAFEDLEIKRFLDTYWNYDESKLLLTNLQRDNYGLVNFATREGIRKGLDSYMKGHGISVCLLHSDELLRFYYDFATISSKIVEAINNLNLNLEGVYEFSDFVSHNFSAFLYQDFRNKFKEAFNLR